MSYPQALFRWPTPGARPFTHGLPRRAAALLAALLLALGALLASDAARAEDDFLLNL